MAKKKRKRSWKEKYETIDRLGEGGNADVYLVKKIDDDSEYALKELRNMTVEKKDRFIDEIRTIVANSESIDGIMPILEYSEEEYWYIMPVATEIMEHIKKSRCTILDIVDGVIQIANTLIKLHDKGISHRDIKPSNIYYYKDRFCIGDFGLVDFPDNPHDHTRSDKGLGAVFTIAPEMKRDPKNSDGKKADVFSFAKTLWMFITGDDRGYDGRYNYRDNSYGLRFYEQCKKVHLVELELLFSDCTNNIPEARPCIKNVCERLELWKVISSDTKKAQLSEWKFLSGILFGDFIQESARWNELSTIIKVLNVIGSLNAYNHMFFSDYGGLDFAYSKIATETGCIYIYDDLGFCFIVKPKTLTFEGFSDDFEWNYFLLELDEMQPIIGKSSLNYEYLVEDKPGNYVSAEYEQYGVYDYDSGEPFPEGYKTVRRYLEGKFLIVLKAGPYNKISGTYDGRHGDCDSQEFRKYIDWCLRLVKEGTAKGLDKTQILNSSVFNRNPFKKREKEIVSETYSYEKKEKAREFIRNNIHSCDFTLPDYAYNEKKNIMFYIEYNNPDDYSFLDEKQYCICKDGAIREISKKDHSQVHGVSERDEIIVLFDQIKKVVRKWLKENDHMEIDVERYFSIELIKMGKPTHLFTIDEIRNIMLKADDRVNNILVIDEDGFPRIVHDYREATLYPVSRESWNAGNVYVGKYSTLSTLDDEYNHSLQGWLSYLESNRKQRLDDFYIEVDEAEIVDQIRKYY